ncbi:hypothetical protein Leryth_020927 [Lithospermum erythrorhizon]|nr:hypothetical protein Leryth_020927 [Lithospermum erythrorhizon]
MKGVNEAETSPGKYDAALLATQIRQLAQEIRELSISNPISIFNGDSNSSGSYASYILPAAAVGAMGYCYMWWKGWSLSDVMFVTKNNMANAVASVSKQLENVSEALASTKRHLTKKLENVDLKIDEQREISKLISNDVTGVRSNLNQIGYDIDMIHQLVTGLEGKIELIESKQDVTNSGLWYLCQVAQGIEGGENSKAIQDTGVPLIDQPPIVYKQKSMKHNPIQGLEFIAGNNEPTTTEKSVKVRNNLLDSTEGVAATKMRIHRSYPVGLSLTKGIIGLSS